jgi:hypothetical protein
LVNQRINNPQLLGIYIVIVYDWVYHHFWDDVASMTPSHGC